MLAHKIALPLEILRFPFPAKTRENSVRNYENMPPKKKIRIPEGQQTLFQVIRQPSNHSENRNDRGESDTQESPADRDSSQIEEQDTETQTESETTTSAAASTKSKMPSENVLQESEKTLQS